MNEKVVNFQFCCGGVRNYLTSFLPAQIEKFVVLCTVVNAEREFRLGFLFRVEVFFLVISGALIGQFELFFGLLIV